MRIRESEVSKRGAQQSTWGATWTEKGVSSERPLLTSLPGTRVSGGLTLKIKSLYIWNLITAKYTGDVYMYRIHALGYEVEHKGNKWWCSSVIGVNINYAIIRCLSGKRVRIQNYGRNSTNHSWCMFFL